VARAAANLPLRSGGFLSFLTITALATFQLENVARTAEPSQTEAPIEDRVQALTPELEAYIASGMKGFDVPGVAIGIVADDRLVYAKGFGVRSRAGNAGRYENGLPDRLNHEGISRCNRGNHGRSRQLRWTTASSI
jgi:CubicO group peptidase (beta-lactamase class C family)